MYIENYREMYLINYDYFKIITRMFADEEVNVENDLVSYSNQVLSEDLQEYLLKDKDGEAAEPDSFDKFLMQHVFHKRVKDELEGKGEGLRIPKHVSHKTQ